MKAEVWPASTAMEGTASRRTGAVGRWWFVGIGVSYLIVTLIGFVPNSLDIAARGISFPIEVHVHGAIMGLLLVTLIAQTVLAGRGNLAVHRRLGVVGAMLGAAAWLSMFVVLDSAMRRESPVELPFLPNVLTLGILQAIIFAVLFGSAILMRHRPAWHRRLIMFAVLLTLQGAIQRMSWLPNLPLPSFWAYGGWLYALALPLIVFDLTTLRGLHKATLVGFGMLTLYIGVLAMLWDNESYQSLFIELWRRYYGS